MLVLTGRFGFKTLDMSDPDAPRALDTFLPAEVGSQLGYWQDEDMELDTRRKLIVGALDPRNDHGPFGPCTGVGTTRNPGCRSGFYVISYADPENLRQVGQFVELPAGHTSTCVDGCRWIWTGGPARRLDQGWLGAFADGGRGDGRPIWVTDLRDPENPRTYAKPIDLWRNDGATDYSHDVDVDARGIAWTSGRGGILGYATSGFWRDPPNGRVAQRVPVGFRPRGGRRRGGHQPARHVHAQLGPSAVGVGRGRRRGPGGRPDRDGGGVHDPVRDERPDRRLEPGRLVGGRGRGGLHARPAVPDGGTRHLPPGRGHARDRQPRARLLGPLLRARGLHARGGVVRAGAAAPGRERRAQRAPGRLLPGDGHRSRGEPELELVGISRGVGTASTCSTWTAGWRCCACAPAPRRRR